MTRSLIGMDNASQSQPSPTSVPSPGTGAERSAPFTLDTSGEVSIPEGRVGGVEIMRRTLWRDLTPFCQGFIRAMFERGYHDGAFATAMTARRRNFNLPGFSDLSPAAVERIVRECGKFEADPRWIASGPKDPSLLAQYGRDFWSYRHAPNSIGCLFRHIAAAFPPLLVSLDSEGKVIVEDQP